MNSDDTEGRKVKVSYVPVQQKGLKVIARNHADGFYYPGLAICVFIYLLIYVFLRSFIDSLTHSFTQSLRDLLTYLFL